MKNMYSVPTSLIQDTIRQSLASGQLTVGQLDVIGDMYRDAFRTVVAELRDCQRLSLSTQIPPEIRKVILMHHNDLINILLSKYEYNVQEFVKVVKAAKPINTLNALGLCTYLTNLAKLIDSETSNPWLFWVRRNTQLTKTIKILSDHGILD